MSGSRFADLVSDFRISWPRRLLISLGLFSLAVVLHPAYNDRLWPFVLTLAAIFTVAIWRAAPRLLQANRKPSYLRSRYAALRLFVGIEAFRFEQLTEFATTVEASFNSLRRAYPELIQDFRRWALDQLIYVMVDERNPEPSLRLILLFRTYGFRVVREHYLEFIRIDLSPIIAAPASVLFFAPNVLATAPLHAFLADRGYGHVPVLTSSSLTNSPDVLFDLMPGLRGFHGLSFGFVGQVATACAIEEREQYVNVAATGERRRSER